MEKVTLTNKYGESIIISTASSSFRLQSLRISPLNEGAIISRGYGQDGGTHEGGYASVRDGVISGYMFGNGHENMFSKRREFKRILNPKLSPFTLKYENDYFTDGLVLDVILDSEPLFTTDTDGLRYHTQTFTVTFTAPMPYWTDISEKSVELVGLADGFMFETPTYFEEATAFYMGEISSASVKIYNGGDIPAPVSIEWVGAAENPKILLEDTGEYILLDQTLEAGERLIITTGYGDKNVYLEDMSTGVVTKDFSVVSALSTFFALPVGYSTISLSADSGAETAAVVIKYKNLYYGI